MPISIDNELIYSLKPEWHNLFDNNESKLQFLTNIAYSFETAEELKAALEDFTPSYENVQFLSSKDHEILFKKNILSFEEVDSMNTLQISLIYNSSVDLLTKEILKLIFYDGQDVDHIKRLITNCYKLNEPKILFHANKIGLIKAAYIGDIELINLLLAVGTDINSAINFTPIWIAAVRGHVEVINRLITKGAIIDKPDNHGNTPLIIAANQGEFEAVNALIAAGANIHKANIYDITPLCIAAEKGYAEIVTALINAAEFSKKNIDGENALLTAAMNGHVEVVKTLINAGININTIDTYNKTPIHIAAENGCVELVKTLIDLGADINLANDMGITPLWGATEYNHIEVVDILINAKADINKAQDDESTPLYIAAEYGYVEIVKALISAGANVNKAMNDDSTPLYAAALNGNFEIVKALINAGANVNKSDVDDNTPLLHAVMNDNANIVNILIEAGADINKANYLGITPLVAAARDGRVNIVNDLISKGAQLTNLDKIPSDKLANIIESINCAEIADNIYNLDANTLIAFSSGTKKLSPLAKDRFTYYCTNEGLPKGFENKIQNLPNFTNKQKENIRDIFRIAGKLKQDVFEYFEASYCELLNNIDPKAFPIAMSYSTLHNNTSGSILTGFYPSIAITLASYNANPQLQPENVFTKICDSNSFHEVIALITKDINKENFQRRIYIGNNIFTNVEKLLVEQPHYSALQVFKKQLQTVLIEIEESMSKDTVAMETPNKHTLENEVSNRGKFRRVIVENSQSDGFVARLKQETNDMAIGSKLNFSV